MYRLFQICFMSNLDYLKPCSGPHSIKEATITFFLASKILMPQEYQKLLTDKRLSDYQQFQLIKQIQVNLGNINNAQIQVNNNIGFKIVKFEDGKTANVIQGINEENRFFFSFHDLKYNCWNIFFKKATNDITFVSKIQEGHFAVAYSLQYIDEFEFTDGNLYNARDIFNDNYLPDDVFNSSILDYSLNLDKKINEKKYLDRIAINVRDVINGSKVISIIHNITFILQEPVQLTKLLEDPGFVTNMEIAHNENKKSLKNILTKAVCNKIKV